MKYLNGLEDTVEQMLKVVPRHHANHGAALSLERGLMKIDLESMAIEMPAGDGAS